LYIRPSALIQSHNAKQCIQESSTLQSFDDHTKPGHQPQTSSVIETSSLLTSTSSLATPFVTLFLPPCADLRFAVALDSSRSAADEASFRGTYSTKLLLDFDAEALPAAVDPLLVRGRSACGAGGGDESMATSRSSSAARSAGEGEECDEWSGEGGGGR